jgi:polyisoprenoid-binding protein YceI
MKRDLLTLFAAVLIPIACWAQGSEWQIDPAHTNIGFTVRHLGISNVHGHFTKLTGTATIDDTDVSKSSVNVNIDAASIDTAVQMRDNDLRSPNYFDVQKVPNITFKSTSVSKVGDGKLNVVGDLTIHGVTKQVTLDVDGPSAPVKMGPNMRRGLSATTTINRKDFGVGSTPSSAAVGEQIKIDIDAELTQKAVQ